MGCSQVMCISVSLLEIYYGWERKEAIEKTSWHFLEKWLHVQ